MQVTLQGKINVAQCYVSINYDVYSPVNDCSCGIRVSILQNSSRWDDKQNMKYRNNECQDSGGLRIYRHHHEFNVQGVQCLVIASCIKVNDYKIIEAGDALENSRSNSVGLLCSILTSLHLFVLENLMVNLPYIKELMHLSG